MPDWTKSMRQTFEYYIVDPGTWEDTELITDVESCSITRDLDNETLGSSSLTCDTDYTDKYIRVYLVTDQNGVHERTPLSTNIYQTPSTRFDGKRSTADQDGYTPLIELKESSMPLGYSIVKGENILERASEIIAEKARAPVVAGSSSEKLLDNFVADVNDTYLTFMTDLIANASYRFDLDEMGRILFARTQNIASLQPIWTYTDDNSSILLPEITVSRDLYGVPNVVEVVYSASDSAPMYARAVNNDPNSIVSTISRGREVVYRETDPNVVEGLTQTQLNEYARELLRDLSSLEYTLTYSHGYCPVRVGDCVMLNYVRAGLTDIKAQVISQTITCQSGCTVEETVSYTQSLWG